MKNTIATNGHDQKTLPNLVGDNGLFVDGDWIESKDQDPNGDVRLIQMMDIGDGEYLNKSSRFLTSHKANELRCTFMQPGDILVSRMPDPLGRACIFPGDSKPCVTAVDVCIIRPDPALADNRWLKYMINSPRFRSEIGRWATGTTRERISRGNLGKIPFQLPPLPEQRRIAAILDKADAIRRKREEGIRLTEELLRSTFLEMFGDPATNPKGWEVVPLGGITSLVTSGLTPTGGSTVYVDEGPIFIRSQNVLMNRLDLSDVACLPVAIHESMSRTKVANGDVLLNITGASIGRVAWVDKLPAEANVNQHVCIIRLQDNRATPEFISVFISLPFGQRQIDNMQSGASRQGLNHQQVRALKIPLPPLKAQQRYSQFVSKLRKLSHEREQGRAASDELFNSLVQRAFRGEL
jgi:type I restriction enzyme S subunit